MLPILHCQTHGTKIMCNSTSLKFKVLAETHHKKEPFQVKTFSRGIEHSFDERTLCLSLIYFFVWRIEWYLCINHVITLVVLFTKKTKLFLCVLLIWYEEIVFFVEYAAFCLFLLIWYVRAEIEWLHLIFIWGTHSWLIKTARHFCNNYEKNILCFCFQKTLFFVCFCSFDM